MISTDGMLTVSEAAKRLHLSEEQVRRNLRSGKLKGQRIGHQWFVDEAALNRGPSREFRPLVPLELQERARRNRESILRHNHGRPFDVVADLRRLRDES
jgi:excisionase family DNA binding protein